MPLPLSRKDQGKEAKDESSKEVARKFPEKRHANTGRSELVKKGTAVLTIIPNKSITRDQVTELQPPLSYRMLRREKIYPLDYLRHVL